MKILDFGLAKLPHLRVRAADERALLDATLTMAPSWIRSSVVGTVNYVARAGAGERSNLASRSGPVPRFGLVLYETGNRKTSASSTGSVPETYDRDYPARTPSRCLNRVPAPLRWIVERLLAESPPERYDSTRDLYR